MATFRDFISTAAQQGLSESEVANAVQTYLDTYGEFDREIEQSPRLAAHVAAQNLEGLLTGQDKIAAANFMSEDDMAEQQNLEYYNLLDGKTYSDFEAKYRMEENYPTLSPSQILNENRKVLDYEPWLTLKKDRGLKASEAVRLNVGHAVGSLIRSAAGKVGIATQMGEASLNMPYVYTGVATPFGQPQKLPYQLTEEEIEKGEKNREELDYALFKSVMNGAQYAQEVVEGDIPNYVKAGVPAKLASAFGEVPLIFVGAYDPTFVAGRYYAEALEESGGDHSIATGYASLFGTIGYLVDRYTAGLGGAAFRAMKVGTRGKLITKQLGKLGLRSQIAGFNELVTEFAESASLQAVTKDEVNYRQAIEEGLLAYVVGSFTAGGVDVTQYIKSNQSEIINKLKDVGFTEQRAVEYYNAIDNQDFDRANLIGYESILRSLGGGVNVGALADPFMDTPIPKEFTPYTLGRLRDIRNSATDTEIEQALSADQYNGYRDEAKEAMLMPTEKSTAKLNQAIARHMLSAVKVDVNKEINIEDSVQPSGNVEPTLEELDAASDFLNDGETVKSLLKDQTIDSLMDLVAIDVANGFPAYSEYMQELLNKVPSGYIADVFAEMRKRTVRYRNEIAKKKALTPIYNIPIPVGSKLEGFYKESQDKYHKAILDFVKIRINMGVEQGTLDEFTSLLMKRELYAQAQRHLGEAFNKGDLHEVMVILDKEGYSEYKEFYDEVIQATLLREDVWNQHRANQPQVVNEEDIEINTELSPELDLTEEGEPELTIADEQEAEATLLDEIESNAKDYAKFFFDRLELDGFEFTPEEAELIMRYVAYEQGYDETLEPVDISALPERGRELVERATEEFKDLAERVERIADQVGLDFEARAGIYFPLNHVDQNVTNVTTTEDLYQASIGFTKARRGTFDGVIKDPVKQIRITVNMMSNILAIADSKIALTDIAKKRANDISVAIVKKEKGEELNEVDESALQVYRDLNEVDNAGVAVGMDRAPEASKDLYRLIDLLNKDNGGEELSEPKLRLVPDGKLKDWLKERGQTWSDGVDPHFIVQKMDGTGERKENGRMYGANANLWQQVLQAARLSKQAEMDLQRKQIEILKPYRTTKGLKAINTKLAKIFTGSGSQALDVFRAKDAEELKERITGVKLSDVDARTVFFYGKSILKLQNDLVLGGQMRGNLSEASAQARRDFEELERKIELGLEVTEQDLFRYKSYAPQADEDTKRKIFRNMVRWTFERNAIDNNDFFSYFDSLARTSFKGGYFYNLRNKINSWADYLEGIGQERNARWWRVKIESNINGNIFKFEDELLEYAAQKIKETTETALGEELKGSWLDPIRRVSVDELKVYMADAMNTLQKARINAFLLGNIGWSLNTQPSSIAFTIKQTGFSKTLKAIHGVIFGGDLLSESDVVGLKSGRDDIKGLESVGEFAELSVSKTKRSMIRNYLGTVGSLMEETLTKVSYSAGYDYAKSELGLNNDDARIHADFVAATTQSMYDRVTRNTALNSQFMRLFRPMQSYVFTAYSNMLDSFGVVGRKRSAQVRAAEAARWILAQRIWGILFSMLFGDDLLKALLNPVFDKGTVGSNIPLFGQDVDIKISQMIPWKDDESWKGDSAVEQWSKSTNRIIRAIANNEENWERELIIYNLRYVTPAMGLGFSIPAQNLVKLISAKQNGYAFEDIKGRAYKEFHYNNPLNWVGGVAFGIKAVDEEESLSGKKK